MMSNEADDGILSVAKVDDFKEVADMCGDVFKGIDYLSSTFPDLVDGPGVKAFLYRVKGELVAFASTVLLDGGQTLLIKGARVKDSHQGRGVYGSFRRRLLAVFSDRDLYPDLHWEVMTVNGSNSQTNGDKFRKTGFREVLVKFNPFRVFETSSLRNLTLEKPSNQRVTTLTPDDLKLLLQSSDQHWLHLFPQKRLVVGWKPVRAMAENVPFLSLHAKFYGSLKRDGGRGPHDYTVMSAGTYYSCQLGLTYSMDIFGSLEDREEVKDHVITHLHRIKVVAEGMAGRVAFGVYATERLDDVVDEVTQQLDAFDLEEFTPQKRMSLWERELA